MNSLTNQPARRNSDLQRRIVRAFSAASTSLFLGQSAIAATSVPKDGFTWIWREDRQVGQYANGDWWVVGPVTITAITPASAIRADALTGGGTFNRKINGTVVNPRVSRGVDPQTQNGYDNAVGLNNVATWGGQRYSDAANQAPSNTGQPLVCPAGTSVVSSISTDTLPLNGSYPQIKRTAVLTVVGAPPPNGSFRPPMIGTDKTHRWTENQLNYGILKSLAPVAGTPSLASVEADFAIPWAILFTGNWTQNMTPMQMPNYGRDQAFKVSSAMLSLHLNYTNDQKKKLYIALVQYGIDIYGFVQDGGFTRTSGGLNAGRKAPLVLAAAALNDPLLKEWANTNKKTTHPDWGSSINLFHEDGQMFVVSNNDVGRTVSQDGGYRETYTSQHVGQPEWGSQHDTYPNYDGSNWIAPYREITNAAHVGNALAVKLLTGGEQVWNNSVFFKYYLERVWSIEGNGTYEDQTFSNKIPRFDFNMMKAYKGVSAQVPGPAPSAPQGLVLLTP